jgi:hypothetical protein
MRVQVSTANLLERVRANRAEHVAQYEQANKRYRLSMRVFFVSQAKLIEDGHDFERYFEGPVPRSYVAEYDQAIGMLELHTEPEIDLGAEDFRRFVLDDWGWKQEFAATNASYA